MTGYFFFVVRLNHSRTSGEDQDCANKFIDTYTYFVEEGLGS